MVNQSNSDTRANKLKSHHKRHCLQSPTGSSDDNSDVIQNHAIFQIHLIVDIILEELNYSEVLTCRAVNPNFEYLASSFLQKISPRRSLHFAYNFDSRTYALYLGRKGRDNENQSQKELTLTALQRVLSTSQNFPVRSFTFTNGKINQLCLLKFLSSYGQNIKELSIQAYCVEDNQNHYAYGPPGIFILRQLLIREVPNVESLTLSEFPFEWYRRNWNLFPKNIVDSDNFPKYLKNLKYVTLRGNMEPVCLVQEILRVAPKLRKIETQYSRRIVEMNKFNLLSNFNFYPAFPTPKKYEECLVSRAPHLTSICVALLGLDDPEIRTRTAQTLNAILSTNATTLTNFQLKSPLGLLFQSNDFKLPTLTNLKCLSIAAPPPRICLPVQMYESDTRKQYFPLGFQFCETFPNLKKIIFEMKRFVKDDLWEEYFSYYEPTLSVKLLIFTESDNIPKNCITACSRIFPKLNYLEIHTKYFDFLEAARSGLYEFVHLKEIRFDIHLNTDNFAGNRFPNLDAALAGFGPQYVTELCNWYNNHTGLQHIPPQAVACHRVNSLVQYSVMNLKELQTLGFTFVDRSTEVRSSYPLILSCFSQIFAFNQRPQLQLKADFVLCRRENLQKILDAINVEMKYKINCTN